MDHRAVAGARLRPQPGVERQRIAFEADAGGESEIGLIDVTRRDQIEHAGKARFVGFALDRRLGRGRPGAARIGQQPGNLIAGNRIEPIEQREPQQRRRAASQRGDPRLDPRAGFVGQETGGVQPLAAAAPDRGERRPDLAGGVRLDHAHGRLVQPRRAAVRGVVEQDERRG